MSMATDRDGRDARTLPQSKQSLRLWLRLLRCTTIVEKALRHRLTREFGATLPRFDVLAALYRAPAGMTMGELSGRLLVSNGNVTGLVSRLHTDGLVKRQTLARDRRSYCVRLTAKGKQAFEKMAASHEQWIDGMFGGLSDVEVQELLDLLDRAAESLQLTATREGESDA